MEPARQFSEKRHFINPMGQSSIPQTYMVEGKDYLKVSSDFHIYAVVCVLHAHTHTYTTHKINVKKIGNFSLKDRILDLL